MRSFPLKTYTSNEKGISLVIVLLILTVVSVLGMGIMGMALTNLKQSSGDRFEQSVYYIAEAGATRAISEIKSVLLSAENTVSNQNELNHLLSTKQFGPYHFEENLGYIPEAEIYIVPLQNNKYKLTSIGHIGEKTRSIEAVIEINLESKGNSTVAIFASEEIEVNSSCKIYLVGICWDFWDVDIHGNIATNYKRKNQIKFGDKVSLSGNIFIGNNGKEDAVRQPVNFKNITDENGTIKKGEILIIKDTIEFFEDVPDFPPFMNNTSPKPIPTTGLLTKRINESGYYEDINIGIGKLEINARDQDINIYVNNVTLSIGNLEIIGQHNVTIYINNNLNLNGIGTINTNGDPNKLNLYYAGTAPLNINGINAIRGSLYVKQADVTFAGANSLTGHFISGGNNVTIWGIARNRLLLAPYANITMTGVSGVNGSIIGKNVKITGESNISFGKMSEIDVGTLSPFFPENIGENSEISIDVLSIREKINA